MTKPLDRADVARRIAAGQKDKFIAHELGCSRSYIRLIRTGKVPTKAEREARGIRSHSRQVKSSLEGRPGPKLPPYDHPAIQDMKTLHGGSVLPVKQASWVLKPGYNSAKIGGVILKGKWKNFRVFTLTLEERATCPKTCGHLRSCFGNNMPFSHRMEHGPALEERIAIELNELCRVFPQGVAIRLHVLGDFYSLEYVHFWERMLAEHPNLVCFGFTARTDARRDPIARRLATLRLQAWERFAIRASDHSIMPLKTTKSIEHPFEVEGQDIIVCPEQTGKTESCSTCGFCWNSTKMVAFIRH